ncbi:MAG: hypothetical protein HUJ22_02730 [Gracilimonas sp.]|uniref:hypothetical protein n=1 Tax=Gracilimonas sp. TaxID=1974203 RepID=UPI0019A6476E|nr:hypothetical protein [Gracilimonas sp.]MBD3615460.1 hypothetical protein [Gracilimonas sp.]
MKKQNSKYYKIIAAAVLAVTLSGCSQGILLIQGEHGRVEVQKTQDRHQRGKSFQKIPPGHLPPSGQCRIWLPNTPPGQQPPPGNCHELSRRVPPGAWLIEGGGPG